MDGIEWGKKCMQIIENFLPNATQEESKAYFDETIASIDRKDLEHMATDLAILVHMQIAKGLIPVEDAPCVKTLFLMTLLETLLFGVTGERPVPTDGEEDNKDGDLAKAVPPSKLLN